MKIQQLQTAALFAQTRPVNYDKRRNQSFGIGTIHRTLPALNPEVAPEIIMRGASDAFKARVLSFLSNFDRPWIEELVRQKATIVLFNKDKPASGSKLTEIIFSETTDNAQNIVNRRIAETIQRLLTETKGVLPVIKASCEQIGIKPQNSKELCNIFTTGMQEDMLGSGWGFCDDIQKKAINKNFPMSAKEAVAEAIAFHQKGGGLTEVHPQNSEPDFMDRYFGNLTAAVGNVLLGKRSAVYHD
jgi:hypothetical protein